MSTADFVGYDVALLLARYGKRTLLEALAQKLDLTADQLESVLRNPPKRKPTSHANSGPSPVQLTEELSRQHPEKAHLLRTLQARFANRTFLPELRDVKRFLERHGSPQAGKTSRARSVDKVLRLLAELDADELEALCQGQPVGGYSSLALISDAILHRDR